MRLCQWPAQGLSACLSMATAPVTRSTHAAEPSMRAVCLSVCCQVGASARWLRSGLAGDRAVDIPGLQAGGAEVDLDGFRSLQASLLAEPR
jgi:hypothetical protein